MTAWIERLIENCGAAGVALLMFLENVFPPIPSELVLPLAGYKAAEGYLSLPVTLAAGTIGSLAGVSLWYLAARAVGTRGLRRFAQKHGRLLTLAPADIDKVNDWFARHGGKAVLFGRLVPGMRTLISVPAGVCGMSPGRFLLLSGIGTAAWSTVLILAGHTLGEKFDRVGHWVSPVGNLILGGALLYYLYRVITFRRHVDPPA